MREKVGGCTHAGPCGGGGERGKRGRGVARIDITRDSQVHGACCRAQLDALYAAPAPPPPHASPADIADELEAERSFPCCSSFRASRAPGHS